MQRNVNLKVPEQQILYLVRTSELRTAGRLTSWERGAIAIGGAVLLLLLAVAACLTPDGRGHGTHQQLGLPGCSVLSMFGIRCPGCGMTTSWAHCVRGDFAAALSSNVGGTVLCLLSLVCAPMLIGLAVRGCGTRNAWFSIASITVFIVAISIALIEWMIRLASPG